MMKYKLRISGTKNATKKQYLKKIGKSRRKKMSLKNFGSYAKKKLRIWTSTSPLSLVISKRP